MQADDVLKLLEKHEEECNRRYAHIQNQLDKLDIRLWGIAALIIAAAVAERFIQWPILANQKRLLQKARVARFARKEKRGHSAPLTHILQLMQTWRHQNIVKTLIMLKKPKAAKGRANNG